MPDNNLIRGKKFRPGKDWVWYAPNTTDAFGREEINAVKECLESGWLTAGKITAEFESKIAALYGKKYGLFVNSGSSANLLAVEAYGFKKGAEVITPACNFNTTVAPLVQAGLTPVFADVGLGSYVLEPAELSKALSKKTAAVMAPHLIGNFVNLPEIRAFCRKHGLVFLEDSCDTIGGLFQGRPSGKWTDATTTSFYASHIITAGGAGGMLLTDDKDFRERARVFRDWGRGISRHDEKIRSRLATFQIDGKPYDSAFVFVERGYNMKPTEMQAAFALAQLARLPGFIARRTRNFRRLYEFFAAYEDRLILPQSRPDAATNWLAFPLTIRPGAGFERNELVKYLEDRKIQTRPLFSGNILKHPAYKNIPSRKAGTLRNSDIILNNALLVGAHHGLTDKMTDYVAEVFAGFLKTR